MQREKAEMEGRLEMLRGGSVKPVSKEEKGQVDAELKMVGRCKDRRARIVKEMWAVIKEALPREEWADLMEDFGVEG
jgi:26S proteasome regulatory subunit (ATPase 3-interacting protein)